MKAKLKKIKAQINSIREVNKEYFVELILNAGDLLELRVLEKSVIPHDINEIITNMSICEVEVLKRDFTEENEKKGKNFQNSFIITEINNLEN